MKLEDHVRLPIYYKEKKREDEVYCIPNWLDINPTYFSRNQEQKYKTDK